MDVRIPSLKVMCLGLFRLVGFVLLIDVCQARGIGYKQKRSDGPSSLASFKTSNGLSSPLVTPSQQSGRVVTSVVTTYILVTLPCDASEIPPSMTSLFPGLSSASLSISASGLPVGGNNTAPQNQTWTPSSVPVVPVSPSGTTATGTGIQLSSTGSARGNGTFTFSSGILTSKSLVSTGSTAPSSQITVSTNGTTLSSTSIPSADSTKESVASTKTSSSTARTASSAVTTIPTPSAQPGSSASTGPGSTTASSTSTQMDYTVLPWTATISPPPGVEPTTSVTWISSDHTTTTRRGDEDMPLIIPIWVCGPGQLLCKSTCIIPFLSCSGIDTPGPLGFPWAKPPTGPPKPNPDPHNEDPKESETPSSSSESSCTATATISPHCDQKCVLHPITTTGKSTSYTTVCKSATCKSTVVECSQTIETTTTTTYSTAKETETEVYCGGRNDICSSCNRKSRLEARQMDDEGNALVMDSPGGLSHPDSWAAGPVDWYNRVWDITKDYCKGLTAPRTLVTGETVQMGISTMNADDFGDKPLMGGTGPLWGCSALLIMTDTGIYTSHNWHVPNFSAGRDGEFPGIVPEEEFKIGVEQFLRSGNGEYRGIEQLKKSMRIFNSKVRRVIIITPNTTGGWAPPEPPETRIGYMHHKAQVERWMAFIKEQFPGQDGFEIGLAGYTKHRHHWPNWDDENPIAHPMDGYLPPWGLIHWQFHPSHEVDGVRRAGLRVWYQTYVIWEDFWDVPAAAPGSPSASEISISASASASGGGQDQPRPTKTGGPVVIVTSTELETVTEYWDTTRTVMASASQTAIGAETWKSGASIPPRALPTMVA